MRRALSRRGPARATAAAMAAALTLVAGLTAAPSPAQANPAMPPSAVVGLPDAGGLVVSRWCDEVITGVHPGPLTVTSGLACVRPGARIEGEVNVLGGAGLVAAGATIQGPVATFGAATVALLANRVTGPAAVRATSGPVVLAGNEIIGSLLVLHHTAAAIPPVVAHNTIVGSLYCTGNEPPPVNLGLANTAVGGAVDQCAGL